MAHQWVTHVDELQVTKLLNCFLFLQTNTKNSRTFISANSTLLIIQQVNKSIDEGVFRCIGVRVDKRQQYSIRVQIACKFDKS